MHKPVSVILEEGISFDKSPSDDGKEHLSVEHFSVKDGSSSA